MALYGASSVYAASIAFLPVHSIYRTWGRIALWVYAGGALAASLLWIRARTKSEIERLREVLAIAILIGSALVPMFYEMWLRAETDPSRHAQSHTIITEEAAKTLVAGESPYEAEYLDGPLERFDLGVKTHFPYMPGMAVFGLPRAIGSGSLLFDARLAFALAGLGALGVAFAVGRLNRDRRILVMQIAIALPTGAVFLSGGAHQLPVLGLMFLALVLLERRKYLGSGLALGAAAAIKQTGWLLIPFLLVAAYKQGGRQSVLKASLSSGLVMLPVMLWIALGDFASFIEDAVRFPLNIGAQQTIAQGPTLGRLLAEVWPAAGGWLSAVLLGVVGLLAILLVIAKPPISAGRASTYTGWVFVAALLLATAGRIGYLVYPVNLFVWARVLPGSLLSDHPPDVAHARNAPARRQVDRR